MPADMRLKKIHQRIQEYSPQSTQSALLHREKEKLLGG
jgi:hypothetical protein